MPSFIFLSKITVVWHKKGEAKSRNGGCLSWILDFIAHGWSLGHKQKFPINDMANRQREVPRLCRGGSKSLTDPGVCLCPVFWQQISRRVLRKIEYRIMNVECRISKFEIHNSSFDILRFKRLQEYLLRMYQMRSGPFEGPKTVKPPALPVDTLMPLFFHLPLINQKLPS